LHFFQWQTYEAYDRIRRAYGLAIALKTTSAIPSCAAWMAHIEFNEGAYDKMVTHLQESLKNAALDDYQARARASLVMADAFHLSGEYQLARPWYEKVRQHAASEGDEATLSAMLYNVAAFRAANVRLADTFGLEISGSEAHRVSMESSSSLNYDYAIGTNGLGFLTPILRGLVLTISQKYTEAIDVLATIDDTAIPKRTIAPILADRAWCNLNIGNIDKAWILAERAVESIESTSDADDAAYVESRVSQIAEKIGRPADAASHRARSLAFLTVHQDFQRSLLSKLQAISFE
jgi:tetratricopeptide (TPR) repeat protein